MSMRLDWDALMSDTVLYDVIDHLATITYNRPEGLNPPTASSGLTSTRRAAVPGRPGRMDRDRYGCGQGVRPGRGPQRRRVCRQLGRHVLGDPDGHLVPDRAGGVEADDRRNGICQWLRLDGCPDVLRPNRRRECGVRVRRGATRELERPTVPFACRTNRLAARDGAAADGDMIFAARAKEIGLAGWVVPDAELMPEAHRRRAADAGRAARSPAIQETAHRGAYLPWIDALRTGETTGGWSSPPTPSARLAMRSPRT